jgi:hypothetical protein
MEKLGKVIAWGLIFCLPAYALEGVAASTALRGFPVITDPQTGKVVAKGTHVEWSDDNVRHFQNEFRFTDGRIIKERFDIELGDRLIQRNWHWSEEKNGTTMREWEVNFRSGEARGKKVEEGKTSTWNEKVKIEPGYTFAGGAFVFATQTLATRLISGEVLRLKAIGATPKPRVVTVEISNHGKETLQVGGRKATAYHFVVRPVLPRVLKAFIHAPNTDLWFYAGEPATFVRARTPLIEPSDPIYQTDIQTPAAASRRAPER